MIAKDYGIIGKSQAIQNIFQLARKVASSKADVLLYGESGTGKELFARLIHKQSKRCDCPFVAINCGTLPTDIAESELFGHTQGTYTGATHLKHGLFSSASGGTCMLDEVGELPLVLQVKLLRFLDERKIRKVGSIEFEPVDVRIIAATNRNLEHEIINGTFREDLYYRLRQFELVLPSLRERKEDIPLLVEYFLNMAFPSKKIAQEAICRLMEYDWPGNVRELKNVIEEMVIRSNDNIIQIDHLPRYLKNGNYNHTWPCMAATSTIYNYITHTDHTKPFSLKSIMKSIMEMNEKEAIELILKINNKNRNKTSEMLQISRQALHKKLKKYQIQP